MNVEALSSYDQKGYHYDKYHILKYMSIEEYAKLVYQVAEDMRYLVENIRVLEVLDNANKITHKKSLDAMGQQYFIDFCADKDIEKFSMLGNFAGDDILLTIAPHRRLISIVSANGRSVTNRIHAYEVFLLVFKFFK